tara:strand:- start:56 stop:469 length:414 start_codon:yes stop_codon:yes gene_type:complete
MGRVFFDTRKNIHALDAAYTVLQSDSGKIFMMSATAADYTVTLPVAAALEEGWFCKFVVKEDTPSNVITIDAGSAIIDFVQKDAGGDASNSTAGTAKATIVIQEAATQGDYINLFTDGVTYYGEVMSAINDAIDHTA